jgi:hypothetical protein
MSRQLIQAGDKAPDFSFQTPWSPLQDFYETLGNHSAILFFPCYQDGMNGDCP